MNLSEESSRRNKHLIRRIEMSSGIHNHRLSTLRCRTTSKDNLEGFCVVVFQLSHREIELNYLFVCLFVITIESNNLSTQLRRWELGERVEYHRLDVRWLISKSNHP